MEVRTPQRYNTRAALGPLLTSVTWGLTGSGI